MDNSSAYFKEENSKFNLDVVRTVIFQAKHLKCIIRQCNKDVNMEKFVHFSAEDWCTYQIM